MYSNDGSSSPYSTPLHFQTGQNTNWNKVPITVTLKATRIKHFLYFVQDTYVIRKADYNSSVCSLCGQHYFINIIFFKQLLSNSWD